MCNPWNASCKVKIARDRMELEGAIGTKLLEIFHKTPTNTRPMALDIMSLIMQGMPTKDH